MKRALMVMVSSSVLFACKKEKDNTSGCPITVDNLSGAYKLTALQYKASANADPADYLAYMDDCEKDDTMILKNDGTYKKDDAGTVCDPEETASGTWQLHGNTLTSDGTLNGTIASFDCKKLVYYIDNALKPGDRLTYTLEKQ
ncbi:MAG: lipocalin family protein [Chitinophagaceae bacterium]|nr:lipocalin family protein [Chitinophagaceae bacterium]